MAKLVRDNRALALAHIERVAKAALDSAIRDGEIQARVLAPIASGRLQSSIRSEPARRERGRLTGRIVSDGEIAPHNLVVEMGTSDTAPQPYLMPAAYRAAASLRGKLRGGS